jgi:hypothetical protein
MERGRSFRNSILNARFLQNNSVLKRFSMPKLGVLIFIPSNKAKN